MARQDIIASKSIIGIENIKRVFEMYVDRDILEAYRLPGATRDTTINVGLSGGADSTVLALFVLAYLLPHYPNIELLFSDTKAEPESCYETLDKIEKLWGRKVQRLIPKAGLFHLIDEYNGFLPSSQARYCTRELKIEPLLNYMRTKPAGLKQLSLAGIRFDEPDREGISFQYSMEANSASGFPFIDLKITRGMVFGILEWTIGIPETYKYRGRSGCYSCFFQRNAEAIGMLTNDPQNFARTESYEKLASVDEDRWSNIPRTLSELGLGVYYPVPAFLDIRKTQKVPAKPPEKTKRKTPSTQIDFFGYDGTQNDSDFDDIFAAFALYSDASLGLFGADSAGIYWQEFVTISTSLAGIKSALGNHYKFKRTTPMPHYDVEDMSIVIAQIRFPKGTIDTRPPSDDSYTWKKATAYKQLRHLVRNCQQVLQNQDLDRQLEDARADLLAAPQDLDARAFLDERVQTLQKTRESAPESPGELLWEGLYIPGKEVNKEVQLQLEGVSVHTEVRPARENLEYDEVPRACIACSF